MIEGSTLEGGIVSSKKQKPRKPRADYDSDKATVEKRKTRAQQVGKVGPSSPIWQAQPTVQDLGNKLVTAGALLGDDEKQIGEYDQKAAQARTKLQGDIVSFDALLNAYLSASEHFSTTVEELQGLGAAEGTETSYDIAPPREVTAKFDPVAGRVNVRVKCAPGMDRSRIEIASSQAMTTDLRQLPGDGARQSIQNLPPGTYWVRAAHVRAAEISPFTGPVAVIVK
jgi:hypothetical protein